MLIGRKRRCTTSATSLVRSNSPYQSGRCYSSGERHRHLLIVSNGGPGSRTGSCTIVFGNVAACLRSEYLKNPPQSRVQLADRLTCTTIRCVAVFALGLAAMECGPARPTMPESGLARSGMHRAIAGTEAPGRLVLAHSHAAHTIAVSWQPAVSSLNDGSFSVARNNDTGGRGSYRVPILRGCTPCKHAQTVGRAPIPRGCMPSKHT